MDKKERSLRLLECDIEIQKYHLSTAFSLLLPFILTFASAGMATDNVSLQKFFILLSMILLFFLAFLVLKESQNLRKLYEQRKKILLQL